MHMCGRCSRVTAGLLLLAGLLFLLVDFGVWGFWGVSWWTAAFLIVGLTHFATSKCDDCGALMGRKKK